MGDHILDILLDYDEKLNQANSSDRVSKSELQEVGRASDELFRILSSNGFGRSIIGTEITNSGVEIKCILPSQQALNFVLNEFGKSFDGFNLSAGIDEEPALAISD